MSDPQDGSKHKLSGETLQQSAGFKETVKLLILDGGNLADAPNRALAAGEALEDFTKAENEITTKAKAELKAKTLEDPENKGPYRSVLNQVMEGLDTKILMEREELRSRISWILSDL